MDYGFGGTPITPSTTGSGMDPLTALGIGSAAAQGIGGIYNAIAGNNQQNTANAIEQGLGGRGLDIQSAAVGDALRRQLETMPARDRALYMLQARLGQSPSRFVPSGVFQPTGQQANAGGIDFGAMQQANANYTPGAGGTNPQLLNSMLGRLGYIPQNAGQPSMNTWAGAVQNQPWASQTWTQMNEGTNPWDVGKTVQGGPSKSSGVQSGGGSPQSTQANSTAAAQAAAAAKAASGQPSYTGPGSPGWSPFGSGQPQQNPWGGVGPYGQP